MKSEMEDGIAAVVARLLALLDHLGVAKAVLFGRDFGAICAAAFKVKYPGRVAAPLVIQDCHDHVKDAADFKTKKAELLAQM